MMNPEYVCAVVPATIVSTAFGVVAVVFVDPMTPLPVRPRTATRVLLPQDHSVPSNASEESGAQGARS